MRKTVSILGVEIGEYHAYGKDREEDYFHKGYEGGPEIPFFGFDPFDNFRILSPIIYDLCKEQIVRGWDYSKDTRPPWSISINIVTGNISFVYDAGEGYDGVSGVAEKNPNWEDIFYL